MKFAIFLKSSLLFNSFCIFLWTNLEQLRMRMFVICVEVIIYLLLHNLYDWKFDLKMITYNCWKACSFVEQLYPRSCFMKVLRVSNTMKIWNVFLVRMFPYSDWIRRGTEYLSVISPNAGKYGPEKTPYLATFPKRINPI